jgi:adenylosuccinate synthase
MIFNRMTEFSQLPPAAQRYVLRVEVLLGIPIKYIGVGAGRQQLLLR